MRTESVGALGQIRTDVELSLAGFADQRLQPLGHECEKNDGAESRARTDDMLLTKQLLCLLSYLGIEDKMVRPEGFEPSCDRLEDGCLNPLGYGRSERWCPRAGSTAASFLHAL